MGHPLNKLSSALGNRASTQDLDYFIDPSAYGSMSSHVQAELRRLIFEVAKDLHYVTDWANDQVTLFLSLLNDPKSLFDRSIQQNLCLYRGVNLRIYHVLWLWVLVRKMKRLQMETQSARAVDLSDCIFITRRIMDDTGEPVKKSALTEFDHTDREPPVFAGTISTVEQHFQQMYGCGGFED